MQETHPLIKHDNHHLINHQTPVSVSTDQIEQFSAQRIEPAHIKPSQLNDLLKNYDISDEEDNNPKLIGKRSTIVTTVWGVIKWPFLVFIQKFAAGSIKGSIFTLMTATLGAGILSVPQAYLQSGIFLAIIQFVFCAYLGYYSTSLLVQSGDISDQYSYMALAAQLGKPFFYFVNIVFFLNNWGFVATYIVLSNKLAANIVATYIPSAPWFLRNPNGIFWSCIITAFLAFPPALSRTLKALRFSFLAGIACIYFLMIVIITECFNTDVNPSLSEAYKQSVKFDFAGIGGTFPIAIFAYCNHPNVLDVFHELNRRSKRRMNKVLSRVNILVLILYILVGTFGYLTFATAPDNLTDPRYGGIIIMADYKGAILIKIVIIFCCFQVISTFPLQIKPAKDSFVETVWPGTLGNEGTKKHVLVTAGTCITALAFGMFVTKMSLVVDLLGCTANPLMCFHFPILFYFYYARKRQNQEGGSYNLTYLKFWKEANWKRKIKIIWLIFLFVLMSAVAVYSLYTFPFKDLIS